ncbi:unnamed protein product [Durusdinium trenchii]|uniref:Uncharacterized protein n=1 Tax=Durusdinium trenchii TaxID=1381693 RepID=A0ABP0MUM1_9DINO
MMNQWLLFQALLFPVVLADLGVELCTRKDDAKGMVEDQDMTLEDDAGAESESERSSSSCSFDMEKILEVVAKIQEKKNEFPTGMVGTGKSLPITTKMDLPDTSGKLPKVLKVLEKIPCPPPVEKIAVEEQDEPASKTGGRSAFRPLGCCAYDFVNIGNTLRNRVVLLFWLACICSVRFLLEQPAGSVVPDMPRMQELFGRAEVFRGGFWMGAFQGPTPKRHMIFANDSTVIMTLEVKPREPFECDPGLTDWELFRKHCLDEDYNLEGDLWCDELYTLFYKADSSMDDTEDLLDAERVGEPPLKKSRPAQLKERADSDRPVQPVVDPDWADWEVLTSDSCGWTTASEAPEAPEDLEEDPEEEEVQEPDQEMPEAHEHEVLSPVLDEVAGDSQCSLHTLLQGQQQMLHQIADATKAVLESQNTPESELYATLGGSASEIFVENIAAELARLLISKNVTQNNMGLNNLVGGAASDAETVPGELEVALPRTPSTMRYTADDLKNMDEDTILEKYAAGLVDISLITSTNCKKLYMRLRRHMDDHADEVSSPQMVKMFHGNLKDRRNLLHSWLKSGEVASKCEFQLNIQRSSQDDLVTEEQAKIQAIIQSQAPILDPQFPHLMEEVAGQARLQADGHTMNALVSDLAPHQPTSATPVGVQQALLALGSTPAPDAPDAPKRPKAKAKAKGKGKTPPEPEAPKSWKKILEDAISDLKKEYLGCSCAMDLPKGNDLRTQLQACKVQTGALWDELKEVDTDALAERDFEVYLQRATDQITKSKMLRVQVRAVSLAFAFGSGDISQNFAERLGRLVGSNTFGVAKSRAPEQRVHRRAQKHGHAFPCDVTMVEIPINRDGEMEIVPWPMLLPKDVMMSMLSSGYSEMLLGKGDARFAYWQKALLDYPSDQNTIRPEDSFPISIYGDEGRRIRGYVMSMKGDWKYLKQSMNLVRHMNAQEELRAKGFDSYIVLKWLCSELKDVQHDRFEILESMVTCADVFIRLYLDG